VKDYGAVGDGVVSDVAAFNAALAVGGTVYVPSGTYKLNDKVQMLVNGTTLWLAANVTLNLSGVAALQSPFGNQIHVYANNCAVIGSGPSSLLQITGGSQANAIGLLHHYGLTVRDLTIDGGKSGGSAIADDTFMSGISIVCAASGGCTEDAKATINNCVLRNFLQYGVNIYGDMANGTKVTSCNIYSNGKSGDALSVGSGIVVTRGVSRLTIANNIVTGNKYMGVFCSSAGLDSSDWVISGNVCSTNGDNGIGFAEIASYASVAGKGIKNVTVTGNTCISNARSGIELSVTTVGFLKQFSITGNVCASNTLSGIGLLSTNTAPEVVSAIVISGNKCTGNATNESAGVYCQDIQGISIAFTPFISGSSTAGTATYASQIGTYTRFDEVVHFQIVLDWSSHTGTGNMQIAGFPYAAKGSEPQPDFWVWANGLTITGQAALNISPGQTFGTAAAINNGAYSALAMDAAATIRINGSYLADS
jgi:hypothetical protein